MKSDNCEELTVLAPASAPRVLNSPIITKDWISAISNDCHYLKANINRQNTNFIGAVDTSKILKAIGLVPNLVR